MIIVPRKFIYAGAVRTGSHFIYDTLMENFPGAIRTVQHHELIPELLVAKQAHQLPVYTVVRDPVYQIHSLWRTFHQKYPFMEYSKTFSEFLDYKKPPEGPNAAYSPTETFPPGHCVMYKHVADMFFPFEPNFKTFFSFIGLNNVIETDPKEVDGADISTEDREKARRYFAKDYEIYENQLFKASQAA